VQAHADHGGYTLLLTSSGDLKSANWVQEYEEYRHGRAVDPTWPSISRGPGTRQDQQTEWAEIRHCEVTLLDPLPRRPHPSADHDSDLAFTSLEAGMTDQEKEQGEEVAMILSSDAVKKRNGEIWAGVRDEWTYVSTGSKFFHVAESRPHCDPYQEADPAGCASLAAFYQTALLRRQPALSPSPPGRLLFHW